MNHMTMFEIKEEIRRLLENLYTEADEDGCVSDETMAALEALNEAKEDKMESIALYYKEMQAEADAIKAEAENLANRAKSTQKKADSLKAYLSRILQEDGMEKFSTARVKVTFRSSEAVIVDEDNVSKTYLKKNIKYVPDKTAIKEALKAGKKVKGAYLETRNNIQIK